MIYITAAAPMFVQCTAKVYTEVRIANVLCHSLLAPPIRCFDTNVVG